MKHYPTVESVNAAVARFKKGTFPAVEGVCGEWVGASAATGDSRRVTCKKCKKAPLFKHWHRRLLKELRQ